MLLLQIVSPTLIFSCIQCLWSLFCSFVICRSVVVANPCETMRSGKKPQLVNWNRYILCFVLRGNSFDATFSPLPVGPVSAEAVLVMVIVAQTDAFHVRLALIAMDVFFIVKVTIFVPFYTSIAIHPLSNLVWPNFEYVISIIVF